MYRMYNIDIRCDVSFCMRFTKQLLKSNEREKMWNNQKELTDLCNFFEIMLCISSYLFFKKPFLGCLVSSQ